MEGLKEGDTVGNYRVVRLLGKGGMGAVYEVEHVELGTHYALKTFTYSADTDYGGVLFAKFCEEAKMLSRISHPRVAHAFDLTHDAARGIIYYVMDLVLYKDGESYSLDEVDRESLDEDLVYGWFRDACEALDHIHSLGIVHRDVKLENFLLDADKHVVLADFGVSRIFGANMKEDVAPYKTMRIKRSGVTEKVVLGSDHYIAPEVIAGCDATPAADAYGLGVMMFKLFADRWADDLSAAQVAAFLHGYKYRWHEVVPRLLEFDPAKRPTRLDNLDKMSPEDAARHILSEMAKGRSFGDAGTGGEGARQSVRRDEYDRWNKVLDAYERGELKPNSQMEVFAHTPSVLRRLGAPNRPVTLGKDVLDKIVGIVKTQSGGRHDIPVSELRDLQIELDNPIAVFDSKTQPNAEVVLTRIVDRQNNERAVVALHLDRAQESIRVNKIASAYGKDQAKMQQWIDEGMLRYVNKQARDSSSNWVQFPADSELHARSILTEEDFSGEELGRIVSQFPAGRQGGAEKCRVVFKSGKFVVSKSGMDFSLFSPSDWS